MIQYKLKYTNYTFIILFTFQNQGEEVCIDCNIWYLYVHLYVFIESLIIN